METKISITKNGEHAVNEQALIDLLLNGQSIDGVSVTDAQTVKEYNIKNSEYFEYATSIREPSDLDLEEFHQNNVNCWFVPDKYKNIKVLSFLLDRVSTQEERDRIEYEYKLYEERGLVNILRLMIFLVDHFRENGVLWGVGRGSSVSSFVLFVIGVNRVNPLLYDLDVREFLR